MNTFQWTNKLVKKETQSKLKNHQSLKNTEDWLLVDV